MDGTLMVDSVEYRLGSLDARMTNVERDIATITTSQGEQNTKLDTLLARTAAVNEFKKHSWKAVAGAVALVAAIVETVHEVSSWLHGSH
jgi:hypothetical protein